PVLKKTTISGVEVSVCTNVSRPYKVISSSDDGTPIVFERALGKGKVVFFACSAYPASPAIAPLYKNALASLMESVSRDESAWARCERGVQFALYERPEARDVYFLACDWYRAPEIMRSATLIVGENEHTVTFPFGVMIKAVVSSCYAAYPHSEQGEVVSVKDGVATVQGTGRVTFTFINGADSREQTLDFSKENVITLKI
ncbi:MAG: hypothetical protein J6Q68_01085, partial [Clostridia bacterium]|nr:hypothetical protein [Clostridia bacterium]